MADPQGLASRPEFAALLALLRGGEGPCPLCKGGGVLEMEDASYDCARCSASGRVAVPAWQTAAVLRDWWEDAAGVLAGLLWVYAGLTEPCPGCRGGGNVSARWTDGSPGTAACPGCNGTGELPDPCLSAALAAWDDAACPARAEAVRRLEVTRHAGADYWCVGYPENCAAAGQYATEPAARLALKKATLSLYDPCPACGGSGACAEEGCAGCHVCGGTGGPRGWPGVPVPMRAEGARLAVRYGGRGPEVLFPHHLFKSPAGPVRPPPGDAWYLDGARVGAPPSWGWTPHALPGGRLAVTWEVWPSSLLPAGWEETREALRRAGGSGWDAVGDPEAYVRGGQRRVKQARRP